MEDIKNLSSLYKTNKIENKNINDLNKILQNIFFVLCFFHKEVYIKLTMDEKMLINSFLSKDQIKEMTGLK